MPDNKEQDSPKKETAEIKISTPPVAPSNVALTFSHDDTGILKPSKPKIVTTIKREDSSEK